MKTILAELPKGKEYSLTAHERIVKNRDDFYNQSEQESGVIGATMQYCFPKRKRHLGHKEDPDCGNQNVGHTKSKIDKQCTSLMI